MPAREQPPSTANVKADQGQHPRGPSRAGSRNTRLLGIEPGTHGFPWRDKSLPNQVCQLVSLAFSPSPPSPQHDIELLEGAKVPWYCSRGHEFDSHCGRILFRLWFLDFGCPACGKGLRATFGHEPVNPGPFGTGVVCALAVPLTTVKHTTLTCSRAAAPRTTPGPRPRCPWPLSQPSASAAARG